MLHQLDKISPDRKLHLLLANRLHLANHHHPKLPLNPKLKKISLQLYLLTMKKLTWTLPLDPVRLLRCCCSKAKVRPKEMVLEVPQVLPRHHVPRPLRKYLKIKTASWI